jgi:LPXTG-site transpeptidase (sortase) family protein
LVAGVVYLLNDGGLPVSDPATENLELSPTLPPINTASPAPTLVADESPERIAEVTDGARFLAPTAGINSHVVEAYLNGESWDVADLGAQVGHLQGTAWTQQPGNIVLAGHVEMVDGRAGIFAGIHQMSIGDPLYLQQDGEERVYQVKQLFNTDPGDLTVLYPTQTDQLTLVTCSNYDFFADEYLDRFIVIAERVG